MNQLLTNPYPEPQPHAVLVVYTRHYNIASTGPDYHYSAKCYHADEELWVYPRYSTAPPTKDPQNTYWVLVVPPQTLIESCK